MSALRDLAESAGEQRAALQASWERLAEEWRDSTAAAFEAEHLLELLDLMEQSAAIFATVDDVIESARASTAES